MNPESPIVNKSAIRNPQSAIGDLSEATARIFDPDGPLARTMPDFEPRAGQVEMAAAVARVFEAGGVLLAEAGTGTGKTIAYLVPAILRRERVLISTGTKNLQEQIFFKDIPALRDALGVPFTATYMKGRANYLCLHKLDQLVDDDGSGGATRTPGAPAPRFPGPLAHNVFLPMIHRWSRQTETGDRAELEDLPEDLPFWNEVAATAETCLGTECGRYDDCFVTKMRQRAAASDVVIVNHHLLCADAAVRQNEYGEVIPTCHRAIVDEAHQLEDIATQYFGYSISTYRFEELARDIERSLLAIVGDDRKAKDDITKSIERLRDYARAFFSDLAFAHRGADTERGRSPASTEWGRGPTSIKNEERVRATVGSLAEAAEAAGHLSNALDIVQSTLALIGPARAGTGPANAEDEDDARETRDEAIATLVRRSGELRDDLRFLMRCGDSEYVYFVEFRGRGVFLRASPIDVSAIIRELLLEKMHTTVLTSATLAVDGTFDYIRDRLGIRHAAEVRLPSEFDFAEQAILYLPPRMPDPRSEHFAMAAGREVIEILRRTEGRAFVLFTSYATMRAVQAIAEMAVNYPILAQGTAPRSQLLKEFRKTPHAVLFATSSFWQGVDVAGDALSCVIVDKLPFASPGDPITAARIEQVRARGGDPFAEYQVPLAILALQQGLGRLIRHRRDRGVLAVLDPRLQTKGYGRRFIASLPPAPVVHDLSHVSAFFSR
ncbi:MAG TPA: ATP-dependent DNA helicase [Vicinamibacterales bacterium]|jgi:ATP-dependent DNA helicase DinG|nr:ATP-dependent DNA helicase [Vicinamibacterales bacterium]